MLLCARNPLGDLDTARRSLSFRLLCVEASATSIADESVEDDGSLAKSAVSMLLPRRVLLPFPDPCLRQETPTNGAANLAEFSCTADRSTSAQYN